jgi:hypothetical protein
MNRFVFIHIKQVEGIITETKVFPTFFMKTAVKKLHKTERAIVDHGDGNLYYTSKTVLTGPLKVELAIEVQIREQKHTLIIKKL